MDNILIREGELDYISFTNIKKTELPDSEGLEVQLQVISALQVCAGPSFLEAIVTGTKTVSQAIADINDIAFDTGIRMIDKVTGGLGSLVPKLGNIISNSVVNLTETLVESGDALTTEIVKSVELLATSIAKSASAITKPAWIKPLLIGLGATAGVLGCCVIFKKFRKEQKPVRVVSPQAVTALSGGAYV